MELSNLTPANIPKNYKIYGGILFAVVALLLIVFYVIPYIKLLGIVCMGIVGVFAWRWIAKKRKG